MLLLLILKNKNYPIGFHFLWTSWRLFSLLTVEIAY